MGAFSLCSLVVKANVLWALSPGVSASQAKQTELHIGNIIRHDGRSLLSLKK